MKSNIKIYKFFGIFIWVIIFIMLILHNVCPNKCTVINEVLGSVGIIFFLITQVTAIKEKFFSH